MYKSYSEKNGVGKVLLICTYCHKHKTASGYWDGEANFTVCNPGTSISHGICPECLIQQFPDEFASLQKEGNIVIVKKTMPDNKVVYGCFNKTNNDGNHLAGKT